MEYLSTMEKSKSYMYKCKKPHHSIVTSLEKAKYCLGKSSHLECPLCPEDKFKPTFTSKVKSHLDSHGEYGSGVRLNPDCVVLTCHLPTCKQTMSKEYPTNKDFGKKSQTKKDGHGHYHCPDCGNILARKSNFRSHMESQHNYSLPDPVASKQKAGNKRKSDTTKISVEETGSPGHTKERSSGPTEEMGSPGVAQEMEVTGLTEEVRLGSLRDLTALKENGFSHLTLQN
uniref:Transcriptional repressor CTCFL-like n=1 Tax=Saccoglossus kowalevskii TaxID=10224 RepID=A0ABM0M181_SACKO